MKSAPAQISDEELMRLLQAGETSHFEELVDRYSRPLLAYIQRMVGGSGGDAEDLLQEVFVRVFRAVQSFDIDRKFQSWIYAIASNLCRDHLRAAGRRPRTLDGGLELALESGDSRFARALRSQSKDPGDQAADAELVQELYASIAELPLTQREVFLLFHFQGVAQSDIAASLKVPVGTVKSRLFHAYKKVFSSMQEKNKSWQSKVNILLLLTYLFASI
ncbi:MAG: sigma-70 family RNA polymerase sigma factor [bacterium]|nr:sigma-70 family RNA polymerase sigma factor [bacterium]